MKREQILRNLVRKLRRKIGKGRTDAERGLYWMNFERGLEAWRRAHDALVELSGKPGRAYRFYDGPALVWRIDGQYVCLKAYAPQTNNFLTFSYM